MRKPPVIRAALTRAALFAALWWVLTGGALYQWWLGLMVVLLAACVSMVMLPPAAAGGRISALGLARFVPFFLAQSVLGGVDISMRALRPGRNVRPVFIDYQPRVTTDAARVFLAAVVSLMPGTLSARIDGRHLRVHVLDEALAVTGALAAIDRRVAAVFPAPPSTNTAQ